MSKIKLSLYDRVQAAAETIREILPSKTPRAAIILGTGLSGLAGQIKNDFDALVGCATCYIADRSLVAADDFHDFRISRFRMERDHVYPWRHYFFYLSIA